MLFPKSKPNHVGRIISFQRTKATTSSAWNNPASLLYFTYQSREEAGDLALGLDGDAALRMLDVRWKGMFSLSLSLL